MPYTPDATVVTQPDVNAVKASSAAAEFQTIKLYMRDVLLAGINSKSPLASPAFTGTMTADNIIVAQDLTVGDDLVVNGDATFAISPVGPTPPFGDGSSKFATMAALSAAALTSALPVGATDRGKQLTNNGVSAAWGITPTGAMGVLNFIGF